MWTTSPQSRSLLQSCILSRSTCLDLNCDLRGRELEDLNSVVHDRTTTSGDPDARRRWRWRWRLQERRMGRGKIEIKKIENATSRQVTFSKRRGGLLKKSHELAVLCDAEVAVIIFSSTGKLFEFASSGSMRDILERYSQCPEGGQFGNESDFMGREVVKLRQQVERLQHSHRHMLGEDLQVLSVADLLLLEQQLDTGASKVRARKNQLLLEEVEELRRKENVYRASNEDLRKKLKDAQAVVEATDGRPTRKSPSSPSQIASMPVHDAHARTTQLAITLSSLRDPQTSPTSLHLGLFPESSFMPSISTRTSLPSSTEAEGESSMRWTHPHYPSQK